MIKKPKYIIYKIVVYIYFSLVSRNVSKKNVMNYCNI